MEREHFAAFTTGAITFEEQRGRRLAAPPGELGQILASAVRTLARDGDKQPLDDAVTDVLGLAGGPLTEGCTVAGVDPDRPAAHTVTSRAQRTAQ